MNEDEKYFFDLNGYIVVPNVLSAEAIDRRAVRSEVARRMPCDPTR